MTWLDAVYNLLLCIGRPARYGDIAGLTRRLLANASGITTQTIPRYETGRRSPTLHTLDPLQRPSVSM
jgi:hypothetical protein